MCHFRLDIIPTLLSRFEQQCVSRKQEHTFITKARLSGIGIGDCRGRDGGRVGLVVDLVDGALLAVLALQTEENAADDAGKETAAEGDEAANDDEGNESSSESFERLVAWTLQKGSPTHILPLSAVGHHRYSNIR